MTDEKNLYLSFFERLDGPAFLLDEGGRVINWNRSAAVLLGEYTVFGGTGYFERWWGKPIPFFADELARFKAVDTPRGKRFRPRIPGNRPTPLPAIPDLRKPIQDSLMPKMGK